MNQNNILKQLNSHFEPAVVAKSQPTYDVWESMNIDAHLSPAVAAKRKATGKMMDEAYPRIIDHVNSTEHPEWIVPKIQALGINGCQIKDFGGPGFTNLETGVIAAEIAKRDASIATFYLVHNSIGQNVVEALGDEEQRKRILTETMNMDKFICFGLTEPNNGSDATGL